MRTPDERFVARWNGRRLSRDWFAAMGPVLLVVPAVVGAAFWAGGGLVASLAAVVVTLVLSPTFPTSGVGEVVVDVQGIVFGKRGLVPWRAITAIRIVGDASLVGFRRRSPPVFEVHEGSANA